MHKKRNYSSAPGGCKVNPNYTGSAPPGTNDVCVNGAIYNPSGATCEQLGFYGPGQGQPPNNPPCIGDNVYFDSGQFPATTCGLGGIGA